MQTQWGPAKTLNLDDPVNQELILSFDKHQVLEGMVVERLTDQILTPVASGNLKLADVAVAIASSKGSKVKTALVWVRSKTEALSAIMECPAKHHRCHLVSYRQQQQEFLCSSACWPDAGRHNLQPLWEVLAEITGRNPLMPEISETVREESRQKAAFWGFLQGTCSPQVMRESIILPRLFRNFGIQPFFDFQWDVDRIYSDPDSLYSLEIKHKYPIARRGKLSFGLNVGECTLARALTEGGARHFYLILVKPFWQKDRSSMYLFNDLNARGKALLIGAELTLERLNQMNAQPSRSSHADTTFTGFGHLNFREIAATEFRVLGLLAEGPEPLARSIRSLLSGEKLPAVDDALLLSNRI